MMRDKELYSKIFHLQEPWKITDVDVNREEKKVVIHIELTEKAIGVCPKCNEPCHGYDHRIQKWRHLDTCQYRTIIEAKVLRINCETHGVLTIRVPWAEDNSHYTTLFEALIIDWLKEATIKAISEQFDMSWNAVDLIMQHAVSRGLKRMNLKKKRMPNIGVDETSFQKRHEYVTVITDTIKKNVIFIADDHKIESLDGFFDQLTNKQKENIESISMDMWQAYISSVEKNINNANEKIAFDRFHVAKHLNEAVNKVRQEEHRLLMTDGKEDLKKSKYKWLKNPNNMSNEEWRKFSILRNSNLKTARAWAIKETAGELWNYTYRASAEKAWNAWYSWAIRSRLEPIKKSAKMVKKYLWGILNAIILKVNNGFAEGLNGRIQKIKSMACGFRNRERFRNAIYFHLGDLSLYPERISFWD